MSSLLATTSIDNTETTTQPDGAPIVENGATQKGGGGNSDGTNWEKRYKDLQSYSDRTIGQLKGDLKQAHDTTPSIPSTPEEMEAFRVENPRVYNMILSVARQETAATATQVNERVDAVTEKVGVSKAQLAKAAILAKYPDFGQIVGSPDFKAWAEAQKPEIQNWIYRNPDNSVLAIAALDLFKSQAGNKNNSNSSSQASAADAIVTNSSPDSGMGDTKVWKGSEIKSLSPKQYEKYEDEIDQAYSDGRVDMNA